MLRGAAEVAWNPSYPVQNVYLQNLHARRILVEQQSKSILKLYLLLNSDLKQENEIRK
jgi:hypothetical protein